MRCIVVDKETGRIVNFIEADPFEDTVPEHQELIPGGPNTPGDYDYMLMNDSWVLTPEAAERIQVEEDIVEARFVDMADEIIRKAWL